MADRTETVQALFATDPFARWLGMRLTAVEPVTVELAVTEDHVNFAGTTHGGAVFSLADCAFSLASNASGTLAVAIDTHLALTAATKPGDTLRAVAEEVTRGSRIATYRITVSRQDDRVCGLFTGTVFVDP